MGHITTSEEDYKGNNTSPSLQSPLANSSSPSCTTELLRLASTGMVLGSKPIRRQRPWKLYLRPPFIEWHSRVKLRFITQLPTAVRQ
jgi:hypothetical protein